MTSLLPSVSYSGTSVQHLTKGHLQHWTKASTGFSVLNSQDWGSTSDAKVVVNVYVYER